MSGLFGDDPINAVPGPKPKRIDPSGPAWLAALAAVLVVGFIVILLLDDNDISPCTSYEADWQLGTAESREALASKQCSAYPDGALTTVADWFAG
jgi:hypothetical protein